MKLVFIKSSNLKEEPYTTSKIIAEYGGQQHKNVRELIETYINDLKKMGRVTFETVPLDINKVSTFKTDKPKVSKGGRPEKIYKLNEQQATFLITLMRNTEQVVNFKFELVKQFYEMREELIKRRIERVHGKEHRNSLTEAIDKLPDSPHKSMKYKHFTDLVYKTLFEKSGKDLKLQFGIDKGGNLKDYFDKVQLTKVAKLEQQVAALIDLGLDYKEIKAMIQKKYLTVNLNSDSSVSI
jgi:phage regulator Rha-like protein